MMKIIKLVIITIVGFSLAGCSGTVEKLKRVGKAPDFAKVEVPIDEEQMSPAQIEEMNKQHVRRTNSLWQPGATSFFRDNRAWKVGDILRVEVNITDNANLANSTRQNRNNADTADLNEFYGKKRAMFATIGLAKNAPARILDTASSRNNTGSGNINRSEVVKTKVAVMVRQVLPNGNLVIEGHQEVRVNHELREVKIAGLIRPKDIGSDNSINSNQIAEARISYGGRGVVSDMQQPRVGSQIADIITPF